jgi:hypothetical protein
VNNNRLFLSDRMTRHCRWLQDSTGWSAVTKVYAVVGYMTQLVVNFGRLFSDMAAVQEILPGIGIPVVTSLYAAVTLR